MWQMYQKVENDIGETYEAWAFGVHADLLGDLVVKGKKIATASAYTLYELSGEPLPKVGGYNIILDSNNCALCITRTTKVYVVPFIQVSAEHAYKEGEGDKSLDYWRKCHKKFFTQCLEEVGQTFSETMKVVCEEFEVVFRG